MNTPMIDTQTYFEDIGAWSKEANGSRHGSTALVGYVLGFVLSLFLTAVAYVVALQHTLPLYSLAGSLIVLACTQFVVQLAFFFHFSTEPAARERLVMLGCTIVIVAILVSGSIWIMFRLDERMMPSQADMNLYMQSQSGI